MRLALIASLLLVSGPALAASADQAPAKPAKEKKICKDSGDRTETRMRKRVCKTAEQWENDRAGADMGTLERMGSH